MTAIKRVPLIEINEPEHAHRLSMDEAALNELADSMRDVGLLSAIIIRPVEGGRYEIVAGHRRYTAARMLQWSEIEARVMTVDDQQTEAARFAENMHRAILTPMEEAVAINRYMDETKKDAAAVARALNRSAWYVEHRLALLTMPGELCDAVHTGHLAAGAALELSEVTDESHRRYLTEYAMKSGASIPVLREWVRQWHMQQELDATASAPRPEMPIAGQEVIVQMPCYLCGAAHDHRVLAIVRICKACHGEVTKANQGA